MIVRLDNVGKRFSEVFQIEQLNLTISDGAFTTFLGPSGCGKTTILRMIAGLETPDAGEIYFDDKCVFSAEKRINVAPEKRNLGFVFQDFALWPHMTAFENVAFPLRAKKLKVNVDQAVKKALETVRLGGFEDRYPKQLSGGQQQRVAFARAIVAEPECILFDEPLSALDAILREEMRAEMTKITKELHATAVFVTHDQMEAMSMSDCIVVMNKGSVEQIGEPETIYYHPASPFAAHFIGKSNWISDQEMVRPETITLEPQQGDCVELKTRVLSSQFIGNAYETSLDVNGKTWSLITDRKMHPNEELSLYVDKNKIVSFH
ncbi:MAG: ABC transporter ATP-binding protein [Eubacteriales bacterium]|nr:ABC transporter ATP-binding protein [Eubacteriales bacterium]